MNRRTLALIVVILGLIYLAAAAISLSGYFYIARLFGYYGITEAGQANIQTIVQLRNSYRGAFVMFVVVGIPSLVVGLGLYAGSGWASRAWLALVLVLWCIHAFRLVVDYQLLEPLWIGERILEVVGVALLAIISWRTLYFKDRSVSGAAS